MAIPIIIFGDGPTTHTGLGRIATDLARLLHAHREQLGIDVYQVGWSPTPPPDGLPVIAGTQGWSHGGCDWPVWLFYDLRTWGREALTTFYAFHIGLDTRAVVLTVWDPARCYDLFAPVADGVYPVLPAEYWGYFPIDGHNHQGAFGGPAAEAVRAYTRVLAYTRYGAGVLKRIVKTVDHLPHGIHTGIFHPSATSPLATKVREKIGGAPLVGVVATNTTRKDWGMVFQALWRMRQYTPDVHLWAHVDELVTEAWSIPQLAEDYSFTAANLSLTTGAHTDEELASLYAQCAVTIAPGRGEGFGFPIVESQACGTPVIHCDYAGGAEFTPKQLRIDPLCYHAVGPYAIERPILDPMTVAVVAEQYLTKDDPAPWATGVAHLDWTVLWPQWQQWIADGLQTWRLR